MGSSLTYNSLGRTFPFPVPLLYELLARSTIMSPSPHILYPFYKENYERLLSFDYILFKWICLFLSVLFFLPVSANDFPFKRTLSDHVFMQAAASCLTRVLSAFKCGRDRIYSSSTQLNAEVFCCLVVAVKWKRNFRNVD